MNPYIVSSFAKSSYSKQRVFSLVTDGCLRHDLATAISSPSAKEMADSISAHGTHFICTSTGRILQLRGVSLSGSSKLPTGLPSHSPDTAAFLDHASVSYVGRPFPLEQMDDHLSRIRDWGFKLIRLVVTWEAIEHSGWCVRL